MNLSKGVLPDCVNETCTAGAGTLLLEFGVLSRLLADPMYDFYAQQAVKMLWKYRSNVTGLLGKLSNQEFYMRCGSIFLHVQNYIFAKPLTHPHHHHQPPFQAAAFKV